MPPVALLPLWDQTVTMMGEPSRCTNASCCQVKLTKPAEATTSASNQVSGAHTVKLTPILSNQFSQPHSVNCIIFACCKIYFEKHNLV